MHSLQDSIDAAARKAHDGVDAGRQYALRTEDLARQGAQWVRGGSQRVRQHVHQASDRSVGYVREQPVRATLIAAAAGALLYAAVHMFNRRRRANVDRS